VATTTATPAGFHWSAPAAFRRCAKMSPVSGTLRMSRQAAITPPFPSATAANGGRRSGARAVTLSVARVTPAGGHMTVPPAPIRWARRL
jgi:hypothetical protein